MAGNVGVTVRELSGQGAPAMRGASELCGGFLIASQRGPVDYAVYITGPVRFETVFGIHEASYQGRYAYDGFWNQGGSVGYVVRCTGVGALTSSVSIVDRGVSPKYSITVSAAWKGKDDTGDWGDDLQVVVSDNLNNSNLFDLAVYYNSVLKETWRALTPSIAVTMINDTVTGSQYIKVTDEASPEAAPDNNPAAGSYDLSGGADGAAPLTTDYQGLLAGYTGMYAFTGKAITHLACPESTDAALLTAMEGWCRSNGFVTLIAACPQASTVSTAAAYGTAAQVAIAYAALYAGWLKIIDPIGSGDHPMKWVNPVGHVMGIYADVQRKRGVHKAPAGLIDGSLRSVLDVDIDIKTDTELTTLADAGVNGVRHYPGYGKVYLTSRSLSKDTRWLTINVRNLFNYVKTALKDGLVFALQEPNDQDLWDLLNYDVVRPFMLRLYRNGAFGTGAPDDLFTIKCDADNNPPELVELLELHMDITFYPSRPAERIIISVAQQKKTGATSVSES